MKKIYILFGVYPQNHQMSPRSASEDKEKFDAHVQAFLKDFSSVEEVSSESINFGQFFDKVYKVETNFGTRYYGVAWVRSI